MSSKRRCPLCRDPLDEAGAAPARCPGCDVAYHAACLNELGGCSTLGCAAQGQVPASAVRSLTVAERLAAREGGRRPRRAQVERLSGGGLRVVLDSRPTYQAPPALLMLLWLSGWTVGGVFAIRQVFVELFGPGSEGLPAALFLMVWLCFWAIGEALVLGMLAWRVVGREVIELDGEGLRYRREYLGIALRGWQLPGRSLAGFGRTPGEPDRRERQQAVTAWTRDGVTRTFADLDPREADWLIARLEEALGGSAPRPPGPATGKPDAAR